jgi:hypothetical protein
VVDKERLVELAELFAALIEAHRDEFDAHIALTEQRRAWNEQKAAQQAKPKVAPIRGGL